MFAISVPDIERAAFVRSRAEIAGFTTDMVRKPFADLFQERLNFTTFTFGNKLDSAIREVANVARDFVVTSNGIGRISKSDALNVPRVVDAVALGETSCHGNITRLLFRVQREPGLIGRMARLIEEDRFWLLSGDRKLRNE